MFKCRLGAQSPCCCGATDCTRNRKTGYSSGSSYTDNCALSDLRLGMLSASRAREKPFHPVSPQSESNFAQSCENVPSSTSFYVGKTCATKSALLLFKRGKTLERSRWAYCGYIAAGDFKEKNAICNALEQDNSHGLDYEMGDWDSVNGVQIFFDYQ